MMRRSKVGQIGDILLREFAVQIRVIHVQYWNYIEKQRDV